MIILDFNHVAIASIMAEAKNFDGVIHEDLVRHTLLNSIRISRNQFTSEYGDLVIACDSSSNWRKEAYPYYKASRAKTRQKSTMDWNEVYRILNKIKDEIHDNFPYPTIKVETAEADDIIASLCQEFGKELGGDPILILSSDKDFQQLQKYSNVKQYSPVQKKWLECTNAEEFLNTHILKGDSSDGVPNILSDDDVFVNEDKRQSPLRQTKIDMILNESTPEKWEGMNDNLLRNYARNKLMIDLQNVPNQIREESLRQLSEQSNKDRSKLFNYFIKHKLKNLTDVIMEF
jgi:5'-3' exonuclease